MVRHFSHVGPQDGALRELRTLRSVSQAPSCGPRRAERARRDWQPAAGSAGISRAESAAGLGRRSLGEGGFTLIDMMMTLGVFAILAGAAVPQFADLTGNMRLRQGLREVERELQTARLKAVTSNRPIRVRFDCPEAGQYRMVELIGTPSAPDVNDADDNLSRCQTSGYPSPAADMNRLTLPNHDGPVRQLHSSLSFSATASKTLEFRPDGSIHQWTTSATEAPWPVVPTTGTAVTLVKGSATGSITVNGLGKIQLQ